MDYDYLVSLRRNHPGWRLVASEHAPFVIAFLDRVFIKPNERTLSEQDLVERLDDFLYYLKEHLGEEMYPRSAYEYLTDWASDGRGWLRRYYPQGSDEPHYDLTPATERVIQWLESFENHKFIGAESRLKLVFDLFQEIAHGSETDPETRIAELERRRAQIEAEIEAIRSGRIVMMDSTQVRERFLQAVDTARALLSDFRQVEQNFRQLDRDVRETIATWEGGKGEVLEEVLGERDAIADSDQGKSFQAFWDFLMSAARQEELSRLIEQVMALEPVAELSPDPRLKRIHDDWLVAADATQRTVARLSEQLRRFLDDQAWLENRRIMDILRNIEQHALAIRDNPPKDTLMTIDEASPTVELPMSRPLFRPPMKVELASDNVTEGKSDLAADLLFEQVYVDKERLRNIVYRALRNRSRVSLEQLLDEHPLQQGAAELVAWISMAEEGWGEVDEKMTSSATWTDESGRTRTATFPYVIFLADHGRGAS